jgi:transposase
MQLTAQQFEQIADLLPRQRGNVRLNNTQVFNAISYVAESGCKWRTLLESRGCTRDRRQPKA